MSAARKPTRAECFAEDVHLQRHVGSHVTLTQSRRKGPDIEVVGTIDRAERIPGMTVSTDDGRYRACRFRVKPDDGSRAVWTHPLADVEAGPVGEVFGRSDADG